jgi:hypothetical protein
MNKPYVILLIAIVILNGAILAAVLLKPQSENPTALSTSTANLSNSQTPTPAASPFLSNPTLPPDTTGFMGNSEQAQITNVVLTAPCSASLTIQNTGSCSVSIISATIDEASTTITAATSGGNSILTNNQAVIAKGTSADITITGSTAFADSAQYTISLITAKGNTITASASYTGP